MNYFHNPTKYLPTTTSSRFSQRCLCRQPPLLLLSPHLTKLTLVALAVLQNKLILLCRTPPTSIWLVVTYPEPLWPQLTWLSAKTHDTINILVMVAKWCLSSGTCLSNMTLFQLDLISATSIGPWALFYKKVYPDQNKVASVGAVGGRGGVLIDLNLKTLCKYVWPMLQHPSKVGALFGKYCFILALHVTFSQILSYTFSDHLWKQVQAHLWKQD